MQTSQRVLTVYCLTPETLHTLRGEETIHMNVRIIIITAGLGVSLLTGPSTIYLKYGFYLILLRTDIQSISYNVFSCMHIYILLRVLNRDQSINQSVNYNPFCREKDRLNKT